MLTGLVMLTEEHGGIKGPNLALFNAYFKKPFPVFVKYF